MSELGTHFEYKLHNLEELNELKNREQKLEKLHAMGGVEGFLRGVGVDEKVGIPQVELPELTDRIKEFGVNVYPEAPHSTLFELFLEALQDTTILILCFAAVVSLVLGIALPPKGEEQTAWIEGVAIIIAVLLVGSVTSINNYKQEKSFRNLNKRNQDIRVKVLRAGELTQISVFELTVGDICFLDTGSSVPADGLFIDGHEMRVDESVMTGESLTVKKDRDHPFMLSGCLVTEGLGSMVVTAVGKNSEWGKTLARLQVKHPETPLQESLADMAEMIGKAGLSVATVVLVILTIYWIVDCCSLSL